MNTKNIDLETERFFISLNMKKGHTFVMLGTYAGNTVKHILCRVGKVMTTDSKTNHCIHNLSTIINTIFSYETADLIDEKVSRNRYGHDPITYQAYDISYQQYCEFLKLLESLQSENNRYHCYKPIKQKGKILTLELTSKPVFKANSNPMTENTRQHFRQLSVGNTCRHTAINLVEQTQKAPVSSYVSSTFFFSLPNQTMLDYGVPSSEMPFYVLPAPPNAFLDLGTETLDVLDKLYGRLEELVTIAPDAAVTVGKFNLLKKLYLEIIETQNPMSLNHLLCRIQEWKEQNKRAIGVLRQTYFWDSWITRQSKTEILINTLRTDLEEKVRDLDYV